MRKIRYKFGLWLTMLLCIFSFSESKAASGGVDVQGIVFSHIQDSYTWHITEINEHEIAIPLPIIVKGEESGWHCFLSSRLNDGATYENFSLAQEGEYAGKVVETLASGEVVRPIDISLTKDVCGLFLACALLLTAILTTARWYKKNPDKAPGGFVGMMEAMVMYIEEEVVRKPIGDRYRIFSTYLQTAFFFILINNLLGVIPIFPGGANVTGNITITFVLAFCSFLAINIFAIKDYWIGVFWPRVPIFLKLPIPIMPFVEFFGVFTKPFALMIRLFANIMAGHTIILALTSLIFITATMGVAVNMGMTLISIVFCVFMNALELFVACLQAYIFTLLSSCFIGLAQSKE